MKFRFTLIVAIALFSSLTGIGAPFISSFTPTFGYSGDSTFIFIHGSGFFPGTLVVKFNGVTDPTAAATLADGTEIQARVPAGAPLGPGSIFVSVNGNSTLSGDNFTVIGPGPFITGFLPHAGNASTEVVIAGTHFVSGAGTLTVQFNGKTTTSISSLTENEIRVFPPAGVTTGPITVTRSASGSSTSADIFYVPPVITGFSPSRGRAGTNMVITGTNFFGTTAVKFHGTGGPFTLSVVPSSVTSNTIQVTVPLNVTNGPIRVETPANNPAVTSSNFLVPPTIFGFSPNHGRTGTNVIVTGANFNVSGVTVKFGGANASAVTGVSFGQLTATVPGTASNAPITVITSSGTNTSDQIFFLPPAVNSFAPNNSGPGTTVTLTGQNFVGAADVWFNGTPASFTMPVTNNTTFQVTVPNNVITGPISVGSPGGTNASINLFFGAPAIFGFNPTFGFPNTNVTVTGTNFLGASVVSFNGVNAVGPVVVNNGTITANVPNGATTGPISVTAPAGTAVSASPFTLDFTSDLVVTVADSPDPVFVGSNLTYSIVVSNTGPFNAPTVVLTNPIPAGVTLKSASTTAGTLNTNAGQVTGALGTVGVSGSVTVTLVVVPQSVVTITNTLNAASGYRDPTPANAAAVVMTTVFPTPKLSIQPYSSTQLQISWPVALTDFSLQFNSDLSATGSWANVSATPFIVGDQKVVIDSIGPATKYYRLKR